MHALRAQRRALQHAEPMLLVDDDEPELVERHRLLGERVRADDEMDRAARELGANLAALAPRVTLPVSDATRNRDVVQQPANRQVVLVRQDLGRRHERDLKAVLHRDDRREQRDDGLAGADVALQQPVHRLGPLHVGHDLAQRVFCPAVSLNGSTRRADSRIAVVDDDGRAFRSLACRRLRSTSPAWNRKNSSKISRCCAGVRYALSASIGVPGGGKCVSAIARRAIGQPAPLANRRRQRVRQRRRQLCDERCTSVRCIRGVTDPAFS